MSRGELGFLESSLMTIPNKMKSQVNSFLTKKKLQLAKVEKQAKLYKGKLETDKKLSTINSSNDALKAISKDAKKIGDTIYNK